MNGATIESKPAPARRFELPALDFNFASLTEGTGIPPPQPSPVREVQEIQQVREVREVREVPTPPQTPPISTDMSETNDGEGDSMMTGTTAADAMADKQTSTVGVKRPAEEMPLSPTMSTRQGSIRRLFSRTMLKDGHADVHTNGVSGSRPPSQAGSVMEDKQRRRSSGFFSFRRLRSSGSSASGSSDVQSFTQTQTQTLTQTPTHTSAKMSFEEPEDNRRATIVIPAGPPPPMIPEFEVLETKPEARGDQWASDMFKNIN